MKYGLNDILLKAHTKSIPAVIAILMLFSPAWAADSKGAAAKAGQSGKTVTVEEFEALKQRVDVLEAKDVILGMLSKYSLNVDLGRAEDFLKLFSDDCVFVTDVGGKLTYRRGKKELGEMLAAGAPPKGQHLQLDYHINVNGDTATAYGYQDLTSLKENALSIGRAAFRSMKFRRISGVWFIKEVYTIGIDDEAEYLKALPGSF